jgi:hypothetical protein
VREKYCWLVADKPSEHGAGARRVVEMIDANEESWERMRQDTEAGGSELGNDAHKWNHYRVVLAPISVSPIP